MTTHYENGPQGMPRVERMTDSTIMAVLSQKNVPTIYVHFEQDYTSLRLFAHAIAEETLARVPSWPTERTTSPVSQMTESQIDAVWDSLDGKAIIQGESQCNWNRALRREFARAILVAAAPHAQAPAAQQESIDTPEFEEMLAEWFNARNGQYEKVWKDRIIASIDAYTAAAVAKAYAKGRSNGARDEANQLRAEHEEAIKAKASLAQPQPVAEQGELPSTLIGMEVSMDVSTGDEDFDHRIFGRIEGLMAKGDGTDIILAVEESRNFAASQPSKLPPPELTWLYTHCRAIGMDCKSASGKWEEDIGLWTVNLTNEIKALRASQQAAEPVARKVVAWTAKDGDEWIVYDAESSTGQHIAKYQTESHGVDVFPIYEDCKP